MENGFKISCKNWVSVEDARTVEEYLLTELKIIANGKLITRVEDVASKKTSEIIIVSSYVLAEWIASNWWRLRYEPASNGIDWKLSHKLGSAGGGYMWPDVTLDSDGLGIQVHCYRTQLHESKPVRYLESFSTYVNADAFERDIDIFMESVLSRAQAFQKETNLSEMWSEVLSERGDPDAAQYRILEALLGMDPGQAPHELIESLKAKADEIGPGAVREYAAIGGRVLELIDSTAKEERKLAIPATIPDMGKLIKKANTENSYSPIPWQRAEQAASIARSTWAIGPGPIDNHRLCELFGIDESFIESPKQDKNVPLAVGYRNGSEDVIELVLKKSRPDSRRFMLMRLVADHIFSADKQDRVLPATGKSTARQKYQRAFAQEFLCPYDDLKEYFGTKIPTEDEIDEAADHFSVSSRLITTKLVNKGVLDRDSLGL